MAIAFRSISNTTYASRTNTTITAPSGIQNDDILLIAGLTGASGTSATMTPPGGFAAVTLGAGTNPTTVTGGGFNVRMWLWWKRASSEAGDYTITHASNSSQGSCIAISGGITTGEPTDAANSRDEDSAVPFDSVGNSVTTTVADTLLVYIMHDFADTANNLTAPSGMTERQDVTLTYLATEAIAATGATGTRTNANNSNDNNTTPWATMMIALKPFVPPAGVPIWLITA